MGGRLPLISIVTPSLDKGAFIAQTIESVRDQIYPSFEHIIVDGGSTDQTREIVEPFLGMPHLRWLSEPDAGQSDAINKGVRLARGEIVGWLNADDYYYPGALAAIGGAFRQYQDAGLVYGAGAKVDVAGNVVKDIPFRPVDRRRLRTIFYILQPSMFLRRDLFEAVGGVTTSTYYAMDWELVLKIPRSVRIYSIPDKVAAQRWFVDTKTSQGGWARMREIAQLGRSFNGPLDKNYVSFRLRETLARCGPRTRSRFDWLMHRVFGAGDYMVQGWPDRRERSSAEGAMPRGQGAGDGAGVRANR
jgi:glycosyltransferase involved in cell wall biosynthesis